MSDSPVNQEYPLSNMARLRVTGAGGQKTYTLGPPPDHEVLKPMKKEKNSLLCNYCAHKLPILSFPQCPKFAEISSYSPDTAILLRTCKDYQPMIPFRPPHKNLDADEFNTFRLGGAWSSRLAEGSTVGLFDTVVGEIFGKAIVLSVHQGPLNEMSEEHAHRNHMLLGLGERAAAVRMSDHLRRAYGEVITPGEIVATVIYLQRIEEATE